MEENDEDTDFDTENEEESSPVFKKNPNMSVRSAKRFWFSSRKSGRPSKELSDKLQEAKSVLLAAGESLKRAIIRKNSKQLADGNKRPRGRPKKSPVLTGEKRPRGRPRKNLISVDKPKRPKGRPRKHPIDNTQKPSRPRGRPRKNPLESQEN